MAVSRQQRESFVLSGVVLAIALLLTKNVLLLLLILIAGMLIAAVTFHYCFDEAPKSLKR